MKEYHKIQTVYLRDPDTKFKTLLPGKFALPEFEYLAGNEWIFTEKIDGTNIRIMFQDGKLTLGGKSDNAQIPAFLITKLQELFTLELMNDVFLSHEAPVCLYGEGYGAKIQKGGGNYIPDGCSFILFDVKIGEMWLRRDDVVDVGDKLSVEVVPRVGTGTLFNGIDIVHQGFQSLKGTHTAEGLVMRPATDLFTRQGKRIIAKIKYKDFPRDKK